MNGEPISTGAEQTIVNSSSSQRELEANVDAYERRMYVQYEVMKILGFLPKHFDSTASVIDYTKLSQEEAAKALSWSTDVDGVEATSNAAIFDKKYQAILSETDEVGLLELRPYEVIKKLAKAIELGEVN